MDPYIGDINIKGHNNWLPRFFIMIGLSAKRSSEGSNIIHITLLPRRKIGDFESHRPTILIEMLPGIKPLILRADTLDI
jgi:hypothetical protein